MSHAKRKQTLSPLAPRQQPHVIRSPRRRLAVEVTLQNRLENAYNSSLRLQYSANLHFSTLSVRVTLNSSSACAVCEKHVTNVQNSLSPFLVVFGMKPKLRIKVRLPHHMLKC